MRAQEVVERRDEYCTYRSALEAVSQGLYADRKHMPREFAQNSYDARGDLRRHTPAAHLGPVESTVSPPSVVIADKRLRMADVTMPRDLKRFGYAAGKVTDGYLKHPKEQARLKLYVMNLVARLAAQENFDSESEPPIFYLGNRDTQMMAFRFYLKASSRTFTPRSPKERLNQIVNRRMIEIANGKQKPTNLRLPLIKAGDPSGQ